jgi:REP element-mobilizing transposase RayT
MSRTISGTHLFDPHAKEVFRKMMWEAADFSGVTILAYCIMTNHFHILVRVPEKSPELSSAEVLRRFRRLYHHDPSPGYPSPTELERIFAEDGEPARRWKSRLAFRMGDLSEFMKTLKQRFSVWYNRNHERYGPLWSDRFLSVLVEDHPRVLRTVAAYIDLNPVRAHLVSDPGEYRWSSYTEAIGGNTEAQESYRHVLGETSATRPWRYLAAYRSALFETGRTARKEGSGTTAQDLSESIAKRVGKFAWHEIIHYRVIQLTRGRALGSKSFVETVRRLHRPSEVCQNGPFTSLPVHDQAADQIVTACRPRRRRRPTDAS